MYRPVSVERHSDYSLAFIELDDQGELWAPSQLDRALAHLERLNRSESGVALVLFVHGWNTDASPREERDGKGTLYRYRLILARLAEGIRHEFPELELPVMGVYVAWRGRVSSVPLLREASFYNRRGAAERIAGAPATEAIYRILTALRENPASRSVLIGHSFGSMILERALDQAVVSALLAAPGQELVFPADLVVLVNPAGSASQTKQLVDILARNRLKTYRFDEDGNRFERPLLVSFTSESDRATRIFFPVGMRVKAISKKFREYGQEYCSPFSNQRRLYTHTAGNLPALHSHEVSVGAKRSRPDEESPPGRLIPRFLRYEESYDPLTQQIAFSFDGEEKRFTITRKPRALNDTPYWIMQVPRELIPNHSAVLTEDAFRLVEAVLVLSATYDTDVGTIVEREDGVRPVAVVPRPDGTALFLDRSRGVYAVSRDSPRPVFLSCLRELIDPDDVIGFQVARDLAHAFRTTPLRGVANARCDTQFYEFEVSDAGYRQLSQKRFTGSDCYSAASVDLVEKRAFLAVDSETGPRLQVADLNERTPRPRKFLDLPGSRAPTDLCFDASHRRLFAALGASGELWETEVAQDPPRSRLIDHDFGWPMALAYAPTDQRLYVADAKARKIWALDCRELCREPVVFLESDALQNPVTLAVGLDGTVWLGDLTGQTLMAIAPDGSIEGTIRSLSGSLD
jgi:hypothetical protein